MNREYAKFNEPTEDYNPPVVAPGHFSNLPDVLIPSDHEEIECDPIEKEVHELIRDTKTPPGTPPEQEPGRVGFWRCKETIHYVAPIYKSDAYQRNFMARLIVGNLITYIVPLIFVTVSASSRTFDLYFMQSMEWVYFGFIFGLGGAVAYMYVVGLCRNHPFSIVALVIRITLITLVGVSGMLIMHSVLIQIIIVQDGLQQQENVTYHELLQREILDSEHPLPYMVLLVLLEMFAAKSLILVLITKYKYHVEDYRIPFIIYTCCFSTSALTTTLALSNVFSSHIPGYDIFQIVFGSYWASIQTMRTQHFMASLFTGRVCPLKEGEFMYALIHYIL